VPIISEDRRQSLLARDSEFRSLVEEHSRCDSQLEQILNSSYISSEDLVRKAELKKIKLRLKDRMELILVRYQQIASH
jgi:uncharacterized protein YdcH (DUF465 family)